ncbi:MAG TPA: hypothetical protein VEX15_07300 [Nocardioidaceae bacterium]|nr:hypothetical protein [Nocardioidaceae bacterium]
MIEHRHHVAGRNLRAVEVRAATELATATAHSLLVVALVRLEPTTLDRLGFAGAAIVDDEQLATVEQGPNRSR